MSPAANAIVVIRAAGERTGEACRQLALRQVATEDLFVVAERPFEAALRRCYAIGAQCGKKWMVTLDADVLLAADALPKLLAGAEELPEHYCQLSGRIHDRITGLYRQAGHRVYRTSMLAEAARLVPPDGEQIRPEFHVITRLAERGLASRSIGEVVGLHDYEQSYADLYRKAYVHARKHQALLPELIRRCHDNLPDPDDLVILRGLWDGMASQEAVGIDTRLFSAGAAAALEALHLEEKPAIADLDVFVAGFQRRFEAALAAEPPTPFEVYDYPPPAPAVRREGWTGQIVERFASHGPLRGGIAVLGAVLKRIGGTLDK